jgi:hypothetical protein
MIFFLFITRVDDMSWIFMGKKSDDASFDLQWLENQGFNFFISKNLFFNPFLLTTAIK